MRKTAKACVIALGIISIAYNTYKMAPWENGWADFIGVVIVGTILYFAFVAAVFGILSWAETFARRNRMGEARFDSKTGKLIKDE
ncbi:hypothetical protein GCM10023115_11150 [Pontixanthobacter gangjinensis]|uniref:Uncharacterized protein n=1 Tax=Pontixanthobacter gangjinensis TaxID=1028742 RepID=A0A6I4SKG5_9SPHN|nr:hypothetical protein [Pontixanthobacter gangjinensis]MXO56361.1 hypothetical protein [Pontixanthobacter gangjinensis]